MTFNPVTTCACGQPLHYTDPANQMRVEIMMELAGGDPFVTVTHLESGRKFRVQRHYIALHGLSGADLTKLGFEEVT